MANEKNEAAVALGKKRWEGKTKKQKSEHARMMNEKRWGKKKESE